MQGASDCLSNQKSPEKSGGLQKCRHRCADEVLTLKMFNETGADICGWLEFFK